MHYHRHAAEFAGFCRYVDRIGACCGGYGGVGDGVIAVIDSGALMVFKKLEMPSVTH